MPYLTHITDTDQSVDYQGAMKMMEQMPAYLPSKTGGKMEMMMDKGYGYHMGMTGKHMAAKSGSHLFLFAITWLIGLALLVSLTRYFWKKAG